MRTLNKYVNGVGYAMAGLLLFCQSVNAANWEKFLSCENGKINMDVNTDERRELQLVIKDLALMKRLAAEGFINPKFGDQEYVISGGHLEIRQQTPTSSRPVSLGGVFYPHDFQKMISNHGNSGFQVENRGRELALQPFWIRDGYSCAGGGMECFSTHEGWDQYHNEYVFGKEYHFQDCEYMGRSYER